MSTKLAFSFFLTLMLFVSMLCCHKKNADYSMTSLNKMNTANLVTTISSDSIKVFKSITIGEYFHFLDSIVKKYNSVTSYHLSEHLLVRANPWIIDTLRNTYYYKMKARDSFIYNKK